MFVKFLPACETVILFDCLNFRINPKNRFDYHIVLSIVRLSIDVTSRTSNVQIRSSSFQNTWSFVKREEVFRVAHSCMIENWQTLCWLISLYCSNVTLKLISFYRWSSLVLTVLWRCWLLVYHLWLKMKSKHYV